jgi:predicted cupin superfamily sugar epimerase
MTPTIQKLVEQLNLQPHPEGGYYRETYRDTRSFPSERGQRNISTAIYFLLAKNDISHLHRLTADETWHFYSGSPLILVEITPQGNVYKTVIGNNFDRGEMPQKVVLAGNWFGAYLPEGSDYTLVGCTVAPGFDFKDFEMAKREDLLKQFPNAKEEILKLTK